MRSSAQVGEKQGLYRNVLVPTDGSMGARRGMEHALDIAERYRATVHVLHVVDERSVGDTPALSSDELAFEKMEERGHEFMDEVATAADGRGLEAVCSCRRGRPDDEILAYVDRNEVDLIVMGMHGQAKSTRPHLGSTTDRVMHASRVPVLAV